MIETVVASALPVDEMMRIEKNRLEPEHPVERPKRMVIVTGTHGDELEGQFCCYEIIRRIKEHKEYLNGIVDVFPALNPLGIDTITRGIPKFDLDMNRIFPGNLDGSLAEYTAWQVIENIKGADVCVDIHSSNIFLREIPQIRINEETADRLVPLALKMNVDYIWVHSASTVLEATLAHSLNKAGVPTLVAEMGVGMRITKDYGYQLTEGIFNVMKHLGIWTGPVSAVRSPIISTDGKVSFINAEASGVFVPSVNHSNKVRKGEHIGDIISPVTGEVIHSVNSPVDGLVFTLREYPIVYEGSLLARILGGVD
ncbi:succinylglutamate desuccinylase/aspartoacylase domain-containing protein [Frisingicoccus sp.]|uniref:M14 family metallopeptidase n=1 Tax=Frisingicoccus sp. TaxID=1918627 RepID=UPI0015BDB1CB